MDKSELRLVELVVIDINGFGWRVPGQLCNGLIETVGQC